MEHVRNQSDIPYAYKRFCAMDGGTAERADFDGIGYLVVRPVETDLRAESDAAHLVLSFCCRNFSYMTSDQRGLHLLSSQWRLHRLWPDCAGPALSAGKPLCWKGEEEAGLGYPSFGNIFDYCGGIL